MPSSDQTNQNNQMVTRMKADMSTRFFKLDRNMNVSGSKEPEQLDSQWLDWESSTWTKDL